MNFKTELTDKYKEIIFENICRSYCNIDRSSRPEVFCKKGVLRNFAKITGKYQCQSLFYDKVAGPRPNF